MSSDLPGESAVEHSLAVTKTSFSHVRSWPLDAIVLAAGLGLVSRVAFGVEPISPIPPTSDLVVCLEVRRILESPLGRACFRPALEQGHWAEHRLGNVLSQLGVDFRRDVDRAIWAVSSAQADRGWIVLRGRFESDKIQDRARKWAAQQPDSIRQRSLGEDPFYEAVGTPPIFVQVLDEQTLILSSHREWLQERGSWGRPSPKLLQGVEQTARGNGGWLVALPSALAIVPSADETQRQALERIEILIGLIQVDTALRCELRLDTPDPTAAKEVLHAIRPSLDGVKRWRHLVSREWPFLAPLLDWWATFRVIASDRQVVLSSELSSQQVATLLRPWLKNDDR